MRRLFLLCSLTLLFGCSTSAPPPPVIGFIGVATGSLTSDIATMQFQQQFDPSASNLVAVVGFHSIATGSIVQATWFSPDERRMPLGRTEVVAQSGARMMRFSFSSRGPWQRAPYQFRIDAFTGKGEKMMTASGSTSFFVGMTTEEIDVYLRDFDDWKKMDAEERGRSDEITAKRNAALERVRASLGIENATLAGQADLNGDGRVELVISDAENGGPGLPLVPGIIASAAFTQGAVATGSGEILLAVMQRGFGRSIESGGRALVSGLPETGDVRIVVLPSFLLSVSWEADEKNCFAEFMPEEDRYVLTREECR